MPVQQELMKLFREQQQKYAYYLIALCVASIAFAVNKTFEVPLNKSQIPLAIAVISWAYSILNGFRFITLQISLIFKNVKSADRHDELFTAEKSHFGKEGREKMKPVSDLGNRLWERQTYSFYFGVGMFLVWHIYEMYLLVD